MRKTLLFVSIFILLVSCNFLQDAKLRKEIDKDPELKRSYNIGNKVALQLSSNLNDSKTKKAFILGFQDGLKENNQKSTKTEEPEKTEQKDEKMDTTQKKDNSKDKEFLEKNKTQEGVKVTASGLQYTVLKEGNGKQPKATDTVEVHYRGTLIDGTEFDSSYKRNKSISFPLNGVIPGWTEGLQLMKEGAKYRLFIPAELGYGTRGAGDLIYPNATLIFEVELIKVQ